MSIDNHLTAVFELSQDGIYLAYIEEIAGVNTQGNTLEEARENLQDALEMILDVRREMAAEAQPPGAIRESLTLVA